MLKKTLLATSAISATLFAVATVLPALAQSRVGGTSSAPTSTAQTLARAPAQDWRQANDSERDGRAVAAKVGTGTVGTVRSTAMDTKGDARSDDRHGSERKKNHDRAHD